MSRSTKDGDIVEYFCFWYHSAKRYISKNKSWWKRQKSSHNMLGCEMRIQIIKSFNIATIDCTANSLYQVCKLKDINLQKRLLVF